MAPGVVKKKRQKQETITPNKLCARCRRSCKQPVSAVVASCPRYYPLHKKQQVVKEWKQQDLFVDA
ncbi:MAG: hypothetical protein WBI04_05015 [Trichlorobacter sp.]